MNDLHNYNVVSLKVVLNGNGRDVFISRPLLRLRLPVGFRQPLPLLPFGKVPLYLPIREKLLYLRYQSARKGVDLRLGGHVTDRVCLYVDAKCCFLRFLQDYFLLPVSNIQFPRCNLLKTVFLIATPPDFSICPA